MAFVAFVCFTSFILAVQLHKISRIIVAPSVDSVSSTLGFQAAFSLLFVVFIFAGDSARERHRHTDTDTLKRSDTRTDGERQRQRQRQRRPCAPMLRDL